MEIRKIHDEEKRHYRTSYSPQDITDAYNMVKEQKLPVERVAKKYGIPITTLKDRVRGKISVDVLKSGPPPMFSEEQEAFLSQHLITMAEIGYGYSRQETLNLASHYAVHLGLRESKKPLTTKWFYNYLDRWPQLKVKKPRSLEIARAKSATRNNVDSYFEELNKIMTKYDLKNNPQRINNIDEKGLSLQHKPPKIVTGQHYKAQAVTMGKSKTVTVIGGGNAVGNQIPPYFVFPGMRMLPALLEGSTPGTSGTVSESGWSNSEIFAKYMKEHLEPCLPTRADDSKVLILYDGHKSHVSLGLIDWAIDSSIILFVLPPHCSHLLQPMDVSCYGPFEVAWNSACHHHLRASGGQVLTRFEVCKIASKVYSSSLSATNLQSAFKRCGVYPFNPTVVPDTVLAPSLVFAPTSSNAVSEQDRDGGQECSFDKSVDCACDARFFLEKRGGEVLKNVPVQKVRKTLTKIVAGKPITENDVHEKIKHHIENQTKQNKTDKNKANIKKKKPQSKRSCLKKSVTSEPIPSTSGLHRADSNSSLSLYSDSETEDTEVCCICARFYPSELKHCISLTIVKWACCDVCNGWVHLGFCTTVKVVRRGDTFLCPKCTVREE